MGVHKLFLCYAKAPIRRTAPEPPPPSFSVLLSARCPAFIWVYMCINNSHQSSHIQSIWIHALPDNTHVESPGPLDILFMSVKKGMNLRLPNDINLTHNNRTRGYVATKELIVRPAVREIDWCHSVNVNSCLSLQTWINITSGPGDSTGVLSGKACIQIDWMCWLLLMHIPKWMQDT